MKLPSSQPPVFRCLPPGIQKGTAFRVRSSELPLSRRPPFLGSPPAALATVTLEQSLPAAAKRLAVATSEPAPPTTASPGSTSDSAEEAGPGGRKASGAVWGLSGKKQAGLPGQAAAEQPQEPLTVAAAAAPAPQPQLGERTVALVGGSGGLEVEEAPALGSSRLGPGGAKGARAAAAREVDNGVTAGALEFWTQERMHPLSGNAHARARAPLLRPLCRTFKRQWDHHTSITCVSRLPPAFL
jgi:hypothetical protein